MWIGQCFIPNTEELAKHVDKETLVVGFHSVVDDQFLVIKMSPEKLGTVLSMKEYYFN